MTNPIIDIEVNYPEVNCDSNVVGSCDEKRRNVNRVCGGFSSEKSKG